MFTASGDAADDDELGGEHRLATTPGLSASGVAPGPRAWRGAAVGLVLGGSLLLLLAVLAGGGLGEPAGTVAVALAALLVLAVAGTLAVAALAVLGPVYRWALVVGGLATALATGLLAWGAPLLTLAFAGYVIVTASLLGASLSVLAWGLRRLSWPQRAVWLTGTLVAVVALTGGAVWLVAVPGPQYELPAGAALSRPGQAAQGTEQLANPATPGELAVATLTYGNGTDRRRPDYGEDTDLVTTPVDASAVLPGWSGLAGWYRTRYWGFDASELPLNARVWQPEGDGPYPLVLLVHGNHDMTVDSERGYDYLAELLASRGHVVASIDQNFLNSGPLELATALDGDMPTRAWLVLQHLRQWQNWSDDPSSPFAGRVDLDRIALVGHSRGGEAVALATALNNASANPDDATLTLAHGHSIRAVVALAPTDGRHLPRGEPVRLTDVSYLAIHGGADGDVTAFAGTRQFDDISLGEDQLAAAVHVYGANHVRFSTAWGEYDGGWLASRWRPRAAVMPAADQQAVTQVLVSGFLAASLDGEDGYRELIREPGQAAAYLPEALLLSQYRDTRTQVLADFEEDLDPTTATAPGASWAAEGLTEWRETLVRQSDGRARATTAVVLSWDQAAGGEGVPGATGDDDSSGDGEAAGDGEEAEVVGSPASYRLTFAEQSRPAAGGQLTFAVAALAGDDRGSSLDFSVELVDAAGAEASLPIQAVAPLPVAEALDLPLAREPLAALARTPEPVFDTVVLPLDTFVALNPRLDVSALQSVRLVFDRTPSGTILLDDVGIVPAPGE